MADNDEALDFEREHSEALEDALRGVLWMFDEGMLWRNPSQDSEAEFARRSLKLALWLRDAAKLCNYGE